MSYILEALRKAESERERGLVPGLNAQPLGPADGAQVRGPAPWRAWAPWLIAAVAVLVAGASAWTWRAETADQRVAVVAVPAPVTAPDGVAPPAAPVHAPAPLSAPTPPVLPPPQPTVGRAATSPAVTGGSAKAQPPAVVAKAASASIAMPAAAVASAPVEQRVYTQAELPEATRRELPPLSVAGASYSEHPANRLLIVNGNVFHEGDKLATDLVLEHIDLKSAVLQFKGVRFSITY